MWSHTLRRTSRFGADLHLDGLPTHGARVGLVRKDRLDSAKVEEGTPFHVFYTQAVTEALLGEIRSVPPGCPTT